MTWKLRWARMINVKFDTLLYPPSREDFLTEAGHRINIKNINNTQFSDSPPLKGDSGGC